MSNPTEEWNRLKDCRHGRMLYNVNDRYVGRSLDLYGEYSEAEIDLFRQIVRPSDIVIEVGANLGAHTVWFAKQTAGGGAVMAFEPQRLVYQTLCANLALNHILNGLPMREVCGEAPGTVLVPIVDPRLPQNFGGFAIKRGETDGDAVPLVRLDDHEIPRCRLLKIDVEGMELDVLKGSAELIVRCRPILYVENDRNDRSAELIRHIASLGYEMYWHRPPLYNPENFFGNKENVFGDVASRNMLCVPGGGGNSIQGLRPVEIPVAASSP
jgi:FkbM family methyltransferase